MTFPSLSRLQVFALAACAALTSQVSLAAPVSSCANNPGSPALISGNLVTSFTCNLYNSPGTYTIDLTSLLTQGGASLSFNALGAGYLVVLNGNPATISANDTNDSALFNPALWDAVLYFPGNQSGGTTSSSLTVDWAGAFPSATTVRTFDEGLYGAGKDSQFFVAATSPLTVIGSLPGNVYNVFLVTPSAAVTPEPNALLLAGSGTAGVLLLAFARKRGAGLHARCRREAGMLLFG